MLTVNASTAEALRTLCIVNLGHEHPTTIEVFSLLEEGYEVLAIEAFAKGFLARLNEEEDPWDEDEEYLNGDEEMGFDPYEGCYTFDC